MSQEPAYDLKKLKSTGLMKQKAGDLFSVRLKVVGGHVTADQLRILAEAADHHGVGDIHLTTRQGIEIPGVAYGEIAALRNILAGAGLQFGACGPRVRTITACQGSLCTYGLIDSQALARRVDEHVCGVEGLPHKFKIAITGCPNGCIKPQENDFGIMGQSFIARDAEACVDCGLCADACRREAFVMDDGTLVEDLSLCRNCGICVAVCPVDALSNQETGYAAFVGGKMGNEPRLADRLPFRITEQEQLLDVIGATLRWYAANGTTKERFGGTIDRVGLTELIDHIEAEVQGILS
ncbi:MAG: 4Fe-4S binding protein [Armatimonadota bacterium]